MAGTRTLWVSGHRPRPHTPAKSLSCRASILERPLHWRRPERRRDGTEDQHSETGRLRGGALRSPRPRRAARGLEPPDERCHPFAFPSGGAPLRAHVTPIPEDGRRGLHREGRGLPRALDRRPRPPPPGGRQGPGRVDTHLGDAAVKTSATPAEAPSVLETIAALAAQWMRKSAARAPTRPEHAPPNETTPGKDEAPGQPPPL